MFVKSRDYDNAIQTVHIDFGKAIGQENDEDAYIVLKELPTMEVARLKAAVNTGEVEALKCFREIMPVAIKDHNLMETETEKMKNTELVKFLFEKSALVLTILETYIKAVFFTPGNKPEEK